MSPEIARNGGRTAYRAQTADLAAWQRARRPKPTRLAADPVLRGLVQAKLGEDWSPQQIAVWLRRTHPDDLTRRLSHETIYRTVYHAARPELGDKPWQHLCSGRSVRHPRIARRKGHGRGRLRNMVSIRDRPATVTDRVEVGHWEGDLVMGRRPSAVATLVERAKGYVRVVALPDGYKADVVGVPSPLTWDRGRRWPSTNSSLPTWAPGLLLRPRVLGSVAATRTATGCYGSTWPWAADLRAPSADQLTELAARINTRPRRVLGVGHRDRPVLRSPPGWR